MPHDVCPLSHVFQHVTHLYAVNGCRRAKGRAYFTFIVRELERFFVHYHELEGKEYRILDVKGAGEAGRRMKDEIKALKKKAG